MCGRKVELFATASIETCQGVTRASMVQKRRAFCRARSSDDVLRKRRNSRQISLALKQAGAGRTTPGSETQGGSQVQQRNAITFPKKGISRQASPARSQANFRGEVHCTAPWLRNGRSLKARRANAAANRDIMLRKRRISRLVSLARKQAKGGHMFPWFRIKWQTVCRRSSDNVLRKTRISCQFSLAWEQATGGRRYP
jgi:hypothetical protein